MNKSVFLHIPAYREPELLPTLLDAYSKAKYPKRLVFGVCHQKNPKDKFDDLSKLPKKIQKQLRVYDLDYREAKGLVTARYLINRHLLKDEDYILQLDSHHRFIENWDELLLGWHRDLEKWSNPLLTGYLPFYYPEADPEKRVQDPFMSLASCFYPSHTLFIQPCAIDNWQSIFSPVRARFTCGHFVFGRTEWAKEVEHDRDIIFGGEEILTTLKSFTRGYDLFHPHRLVIWHAFERKERQGILPWDDNPKLYDQDRARAKIRQIMGIEDNGFVLKKEDKLGKIRTLSDYEVYAGLNFKSKEISEYTKKRRFPPNPINDKMSRSIYHLVTITRELFPRDDYENILVALDDDRGIGIDSFNITGYQLREFIKTGEKIHFEKYFSIDGSRKPARVVYWANGGGEWFERYEFPI